MGNKAYPLLSANAPPIAYSEINSGNDYPHDQRVHIIAPTAHQSSLNVNNIL